VKVTPPLQQGHTYSLTHYPTGSRAANYAITAALLSITCRVCPDTSLKLRSHRHECEAESGIQFTGCPSLVQASPAPVERSRSLVQAHSLTQRVSIDNLHWNRIEWMLCEQSNTIL